MCEILVELAFQDHILCATCEVIHPVFIYSELHFVTYTELYDKLYGVLNATTDTFSVLE